MRIFWRILYSDHEAQYTAHMKKRNVLQIVHEWIGEVLNPGDTAIDATVGNGHDTLLLAQKVGDTGKVYGFDIQAAALESTQNRLNEAKVADWVILINSGHERMKRAIPNVEQGTVKVFTFNLGYLPGHQTKELITQPETTLQALKQSIDLLAPGGIVTLVMYVGHPGGAEEAQAVLAWSKTLDISRFSIERYDSPYQQNHPPFGLKIQLQS